MRNTLVLALTASLVLAACGKDAVDQSTEVAESKQPWAEFAATVIDDYYARNPETAVDAGLHQYDGQMSDLSMAAVEEYAAMTTLRASRRSSAITLRRRSKASCSGFASPAS